VRCRVGGDEGERGQGSEDDAPESLFAKELRRRGMSTGSIPSGEKAGTTAEAEEGGRGGRKRVAAAAEFERAAAGMDGQRERSMALNSEGIEVCDFAFFLITVVVSFHSFWICRSANFAIFA
jgi:hypothetical protein